MLALFFLFGRPAAGEEVVAIVWHEVEPKYSDLTCAMVARKANRPTDGYTYGCQVDRGGLFSRVCHIWAPDVQRGDNNGSRIKTLGHEVKHCFDGSFHDRDGTVYESTKTDPLKLLPKQALRE